MGQSKRLHEALRPSYQSIAAQMRTGASLLHNDQYHGLSFLFMTTFIIVPSTTDARPMSQSINIIRIMPYSPQ